MSQRSPLLQFDDKYGNALEDEVTKVFVLDAGFKWKDHKGAPIGPFAVLAYTPDIFPPYLKLADAVLQEKGIEPRSRELASLAVAAVFEISFIRYAHSQVGLKLGLSQEQVASAVSGRTPDGLTDTEEVTYDTALKLARARGPLDKESREVAVGRLGREGVARVGHVVAWFIYNSTLLNLGAVEVPTD